MAKAQKVIRVGADQRRHADNITRLTATGKLESAQAKRLARLKRNHPDKAR